MDTSPAATRRSSLGRLFGAAAITAVLAVGAVACSDDDAAPADVPSGGSAAERGEQLSRSSGCAGCHGADFGGGAGPEWIGLAGSDVLLSDGSTVVADTDYLTRAIADPSAELVDGYTLKMPANNLSDADVADIVAFIETLAEE